MSDPFATFDLARAVPAPFLPEDEGVPYASFRLPPELSEVDTFALLCWKFDGPQGVLSVFGRPGGDPDSPFKWDFSFTTGDGLDVWFQRTWIDLTVVIKGRVVSLDDILSFLRFNLDRYSGLVAAVRETLELHTLIINPYVRHRNMAKFAHDELSKLTVPSIWYPTTERSGMASSKEAMKRHVASHREHALAASKETFFSVTLESESAYMAEAFLNVLLALTMQDVIRSTKALFDEHVRKPWKTKVQNLPITSKVVTKAADLSDDRIRKTSELFELRNRIAHSYPDPAHLSVDHMYFLDCFPILEHPVPFDRFVIQNHRVLPTRQEALTAFKAAGEFCDYVIELVDPEAREDLARAAAVSPLGFNAKKGRFSIPFDGKAVVKAFVTPGAERPRSTTRKRGGDKSGGAAKPVGRKRKV